MGAAGRRLAEEPAVRALSRFAQRRDRQRHAPADLGLQRRRGAEVPFELGTNRRGATCCAPATPPKEDRHMNTIIFIRNIFKSQAARSWHLLSLAVVLGMSLLPSSALAAVSPNPILPGYHADPY